MTGKKNNFQVDRCIACSKAQLRAVVFLAGSRPSEGSTLSVSCMTEDPGRGGYHWVNGGGAKFKL